MVYRVSIFTYLLTSIIGAGAQQCVPESVFYIHLEDTTLSWEPSTNCEGTTYIATVHARNAGAVEYAYQGEGTTLNISFLPFCRSYIFTVSPVSPEHIVGPYSQIGAYISLPEGTSIAITNITGYQIQNNVLLEWQVLSEYLYCLDHYKLLLWTKDSTDPEEISTTMNGYYITDVSFCMVYRVNISVVFGGAENPVSTYNYTVPSATNNLSLVSIKQNAFSINTTWVLDSYSVNSCTVNSLQIAGTGINTTIPIQDSPERPEIDVNVAGLTANSMYYFNVTVENEAGTSRPLQLAVQTLPIESESEFWVLDKF